MLARSMSKSGDVIKRGQAVQKSIRDYTAKSATQRHGEMAGVKMKQGVVDTIAPHLLLSSNGFVVLDILSYCGTKPIVWLMVT